MIERVKVERLEEYRSFCYAGKERMRKWRNRSRLHIKNCALNDNARFGTRKKKNPEMWDDYPVNAWSERRGDDCTGKLRENSFLLHTNVHTEKGMRLGRVAVGRTHLIFLCSRKERINPYSKEHTVWYTNTCYTGQASLQSARRLLQTGSRHLVHSQYPRRSPCA